MISLLLTMSISEYSNILTPNILTFQVIPRGSQEKQIDIKYLKT